MTEASGAGSAPLQNLGGHQQQSGVSDVQMPVRFVRNPRARRYILRLTRDGSARVTVPRGGSLDEARRFLQRNRAWLVGQCEKLRARAERSRWIIGAHILFRGESSPIELDAERPGHVRIGPLRFPMQSAGPDLRHEIEAHFWRIAWRELPARVLELAVLHNAPVTRVTVRNQKSRWGSCSRRGTVSLNWRLVQAPEFVRDYIIIHEISHIRHMNHSAAFWSEVARICPDYLNAEAWLKRNSALLR